MYYIIDDIEIDHKIARVFLGLCRVLKVVENEGETKKNVVHKDIKIMTPSKQYIVLVLRKNNLILDIESFYEVIQVHKI